MKTCGPQLSGAQATDNQGWVQGLATLLDLSNSASRFACAVHVGTRCVNTDPITICGVVRGWAKGVRDDDVQMAISSGNIQYRGKPQQDARGRAFSSPARLEARFDFGSTHTHGFRS